jgi:hypothetical protein
MVVLRFMPRRISIAHAVRSAAKSRRFDHKKPADPPAVAGKPIGR